MDGTSHSADVLIGGDGVHSKTRAALVKNAPSTYRTNNSAFRFILERKVVEADPVTKALIEAQGSMDMWYGPDRKVVLYPTFHGTLLNFVCVHPAHLSDAGNDYNKSASKAALLETYKEFHPAVLALLDKADPDEVKVFPFFDMAQLPTFAADRIAVIGDAAHPFTPHLAQGGAMAIEDAVSLAIMLEGSITSDEVPQRLQWYNQARYERASTIQEYSRQVGGDGLDASGKPYKASDLKGRARDAAVHGTQLMRNTVYEYINYGLSHDEVHASTHYVRSMKWQSETLRPKWRQPTAFGPLPGPRQTSLSTWPATGLRHTPARTTSSISFKTSATLLRNMFPSSQYHFEKTDTVAHVTFAVESLRDLPWLGGGGYDIATLYIHGVCYKSIDGSVRRGSYCPIMIENLADPISTGREELGIPKVFSDIHIKHDSSSCHIDISWREANWAFLEMSKLEPSSDVPDPTANHDEGILVHKYIPSAEPGEADADYDILHPVSHSSKVVSSRCTDVDSVRFGFHDLGPAKLPTLHPVASRLAELPILEVVRGSRFEYDGVPDFSGQERLK
jgi:acetoacetate decarboxylase